MPTLATLAQKYGGKIDGDPNTQITSVAPIASAQPDQLTFYTSPGIGSSAATHLHALKTTRAAAIILTENDPAANHIPKATARWLVKDNPRRTFAQATTHLHPPEPPLTGISKAAHIHSTATIAPDAAIAAGAVIGANAQIGARAQIHPGAVIGSHVKVGQGSTLHPHVVLYPRVEIGQNCLLHAGAVIGADGFGHLSPSEESDHSTKIPQIGTVIIGNNVEIGANTAIDCGAIENTTIEDNVKIDNLVQIGHNVRIGKNTIICGTTAIAGSTTIGANVIIGGGSGITGHITIADNARIAGATTVTRTVEKGQTVSSTMPALPIKTWKKLIAHLRRQIR